MNLLVTYHTFPPTEFIQGMSQFSVKGDKESKMRFAFRIYDMDNDGYISNGELFQVLSEALRSNGKVITSKMAVDSGNRIVVKFFIIRFQDLWSMNFDPQ